MEFCLFYQGELPSNGDKKDKHRIRKELTPQFKKLWDQEPLNTLLKKKVINPESGTNKLLREVGSQKFLPIVTSELHLHAELTIEMLRSGRPGDLVQGGDIDNRLKTLFDALRMPNEKNELVDTDNKDGEPIFCLLEDDRLISRVDVTSHQLLQSTDEKYVFLLIKVLVKVSQSSWDNIGL